MSKHTPGPWYVARATPNEAIPARHDGTIWRPDPQSDFLCVLSDTRPLPAGKKLYGGAIAIVSAGTEANARLIAAAPDMLAALRLAMADGFLASEALDAVEAAIAKAAGQ